MKKVFFFDIDGTLLPNGRKTPIESTVYAIKELIKSDHTVFIATGKNLQDAKTIGSMLGVENFMSTNGQTIFFEGEFIDRQFMKKTDLEYWRKLASDYDCAIGMQSDYDRYVIESEKIHLIEEFFDIVNLEYPVVEKEIRDEENINQMFIAGDFEKIKYDKSKYKIVQWTEIGADVLPIDASKGRAISFFIDQHPEYVETYAFGDGHNDLEMFEQVEYSVAMGNSHEDVKMKAKYVTNSDTENGIYNFLVKHRLIKELK